VPTAGGTFTFALHLYWKHNGVSPFNPDCTEDAVKTLSITVQGTPPPPPPPPPPAQGPVIVSRTQVTTTYRLAHFPPASESVQVSSSGTASVSFTAQVSTASGGPWLSVTPTAATTPATLSIEFSVSGLAVGTYSGTVTLLSGGAPQAAIAVTLNVVADSGLVLKATPASLAFTAVVGGAASPQSFTVTAGSDNVIFLADMSAPPNGKWLVVSPGGAVTPASLSVTVDTKGLTPGTYTGVITLHLSGLSSVAQTIPVTLTVMAAPTLPTINTNGAVNAGSLTTAIAPGAWVSIFGANLSATTRQWANSDFVGGKLPLSLDGVGVMIDGKAAAVAYVSPTQLNVLAPDSTSTGLVFVQVKAPAGNSDTALVLQQTAAPAFFQFRAPTATYVAGTHADYSLLAGPALVQQGMVGTPARPGETIVLYGTGFGTTQPPISATAPVTAPLPLANAQDLRVRIAGVDSQVVFGGLVAPGLYQFNVVVPNVPDGDQLVEADLRGLLTRAGLLLTVKR
jgi:uncharacterized protein (TIGR03437 family)